MKFHTMTTSMFLALSMAGCAAGDDSDQAPLPEPEVCEATGDACPGETICGSEACEPAFDRPYRVRVASVWVQSTKQLQLCERDPGCQFESNMAVHFSELSDPILTAPSLSSPAQIVVTRDSFLVIDLGDVSCVVDLTAEQLSAGSAHCVGPTRSLALDIDAL